MSHTRYTRHSSDAKRDAQQNLCGRTHYVDDDSLRYHKSRIMSARTTDNGLLYAIVTSDALDYQNTKRGFRYVIFDLFGNVISRTPLDGAFRRSEQAEKAMWTMLNATDARAVNLAALDRYRAAVAQEITDLQVNIEKAV